MDKHNGISVFGSEHLKCWCILPTSHQKMVCMNRWRKDYDRNKTFYSVWIQNNCWNTDKIGSFYLFLFFFINCFWKLKQGSRKQFTLWFCQLFLFFNFCWTKNTIQCYLLSVIMHKILCYHYQVQQDKFWRIESTYVDKFIYLLSCLFLIFYDFQLLKIILEKAWNQFWPNVNTLLRAMANCSKKWRKFMIMWVLIISSWIFIKWSLVNHHLFTSISYWLLLFIAIILSTLQIRNKGKFLDGTLFISFVFFFCL